MQSKRWQRQKNKQIAVAKDEFFSCTVDLVEGLLDLLLAPITVYVDSQHQSLERGRKASRKNNRTEGFQETTTNMVGLQVPWKGNTCCKHKQSCLRLLWRENGSKKTRQDGRWWSWEEASKCLTHLHLEDILLAHPGTGTGTGTAPLLAEC